MINEGVNGGFPPRAPTGDSQPVLSAVPAKEPVAAKPDAKATAPEQVQLTVGDERLEAAVKKLNDYSQNMRRTLSFTVEESTGRTVISVYDAETHELIRQIPPEDTLNLAERIAEETRALLLKEQA